MACCPGPGQSSDLAEEIRAKKVQQLSHDEDTIDLRTRQAVQETANGYNSAAHQGGLQLANGRDQHYPPQATDKRASGGLLLCPQDCTSRDKCLDRGKRRPEVAVNGATPSPSDSHGRREHQRLSVAEQEEEQEKEWQKKVLQLRRSRVEENRAAVTMSVAKLQAGCWMARDDEKFQEGWQDATLTMGQSDTAGELTPRTEKINSCKVRMKEKMDAISKVAAKSPLVQVPATEAIRYFAEQIPEGEEMTSEIFLEATKTLMAKYRRKVKDDHILEIFKALDMDDTDGLDRIEWISAVPLFYGASLEVATTVFNEIDADKNGVLDLEEFGNYAGSTVCMLVPPEDWEVREKLRKNIAVKIFKAIDIDFDGTLTADEFATWSQMNSLGSAAIECLEEIVREGR